MLKVGDIILRVDKENTAGLPADKVHALLQGPAGTTVKVKYMRPPNTYDMTCKLLHLLSLSRHPCYSRQDNISGTLLRELGTEHILQQKHGAWKTQDLTDNKAKAAEARWKSDHVNHGYEKINEHRVAHKEDKMSPQELAAYQARRQAEDDANIKAADALVGRLEARDKAEMDAKAKEFAKNNPNAKWNPYEKKEAWGAQEARRQMQFLGIHGRTQDDKAAEYSASLQQNPSRWPFDWGKSSQGNQQVEAPKKQWWDFMPEHRDRTGETRNALLKATVSGDHSKLVKVCVDTVHDPLVVCMHFSENRAIAACRGQAAADHKVAKQDRKIHELFHGKEKKDNWWHLCLLPVSMHSHILHVLSSEPGCDLYPEC